MVCRFEGVKGKTLDLVQIFYPLCFAMDQRPLDRMQVAGIPVGVLGFNDEAGDL